MTISTMNSSFVHKIPVEYWKRSSTPIPHIQNSSSAPVLYGLEIS